jgi:hypothetical protein
VYLEIKYLPLNTPFLTAFFFQGVAGKPISAFAPLMNECINLARSEINGFPQE